MRQVLICGAIAFTFIANIQLTSAQRQLPSNVRPVITVDGRKEPEKVPAWIKWQSFFRRVLFLYDKRPEWLAAELGQTVGVTIEDLVPIIDQAREVERKTKLLDFYAKQLLWLRLATPSKMTELDQQLERMVLEHRGKLSELLTTEAFGRVQTYVDRFVSRDIVVGELKD